MFSESRVTPNIPKQEFLELEAMEMMTPNDANQMADWLGVGTNQFDSVQAEAIIKRMEEHRENSQKGWPRSWALIAARLFSSQGHIDSIANRKEIYTRFLDKFGDQATDILEEGWQKEERAFWAVGEGEDNTEMVFNPNQNPVKTDIAPVVDEVVIAWLAEREQQKTAAQPEVEEKEEQTVDVQEFWENLTEKQQGVVHDLAEALVDFPQIEADDIPMIKLLTDTLDNEIVFAHYALSTGGKERGKAKKTLVKLLNLGENVKDKNIKAIIANDKFFRELVPVIKWQMGEVGTERERQAQLEMRQKEFGTAIKQIGLLSLERNDLDLVEKIENLTGFAKGELDMELPGLSVQQELDPEDYDMHFNQLELVLEKDWLKGGTAKLVSQTLKGLENKILNGIIIMQSVAQQKVLPDGFDLVDAGKGIKLVRKDDNYELADVSAEDGKFVLKSKSTADLFEGMTVLGQAYLNLTKSDKQMSYFTLDLSGFDQILEGNWASDQPAAVEAPAEEEQPEVPEETTGTVPVGEAPMEESEKVEVELVDWLAGLGEDKVPPPAEEPAVLEDTQSVEMQKKSISPEEEAW